MIPEKVLQKDLALCCTFFDLITTDNDLRKQSPATNYHSTTITTHENLLSKPAI